MQKHLLTAVLIVAAGALGALAGFGESPRRADAQNQLPRSAIGFFTVQAIANGQAQIPVNCADVSMLSVTVPQNNGAIVPGVVVLCERR